MAAAGGGEVRYVFTAQSADLESALVKLQAEMAALPENKKIDVSLRESILPELARIKAELAAIPDEEVDVKVRQGAVSDINKLETLFANFFKRWEGKKVGPLFQQDFETRLLRAEQRMLTFNRRISTFTQEASGAEQATRRIGAGAERMGTSVERAGTSLTRATRSFSGLRGVQARTPFESLTSNAGRLSVMLRRIPPLMSGIVAVAVGALTPAILALVAAIGAAVTAAGALATALAAALGPAVAVAIAFAVRLAKVLQALQTRQQALNAGYRRGAGEELRALQTTQRHVQSRRSIADATRAAADAERSYREAVTAARQEIADAADTQREAQREQTQAVRDLRDATVQAYADMKQAALDAKQAVLDVRDAQLGITDAKLATQRAILDLKKFRNEAGRGAASLDNLFKRATDVTIDPRQARKAIGQIAAQGDKLDEDQRLRLLELIQRVKHSKLDELEATNRLKRAELDETEAKRKSADFAERGIAASDGYRSAQDRLRTANRNLADATDDLNELTKQGVRNASAVVAADEAKADAARNLKRARQDAAEQEKEARLQEEGAAGGLSLYREQLSKLSETERRFAEMIVGVGTALRDIFSGATDQIFAALMASMQRVLGAANLFKGQLTAAFTGIGVSIGNVITELTDHLLRLDNVFSMEQIFAGGQQIIPQIGKALGSLFDIFMNIAETAMPLLIDEFDKFNNWLSNISQASENIDGMRKALVPMVDSLNTFLSIGATVAQIFIQVFLDAQKPILEFLHWIDRGLQSFLNWSRSAKGKNDIKAWFDDTLPLAKEFIGFIKDAAVFVAALMQDLAPFLTDVLKIFRSVLRFASKLLRVWNKLPQPLQDFIAWTIVARIGLSKLPKLLGPVASGLAKLVGPRGLAEATKAGAGYAKWFFKPLTDGLKAVKDGATTVANSLAKKLFLKPYGGPGPIKRAYDAITSTITTAGQNTFNAAKRIATNIKGAFADIGSWAFGRGKALTKGLSDGISSLAGNIAGKASALRQSVVNGLGNFYSFSRGKGNAIVNGIRDALTAGVGRLATAARAARAAVANVLAAAATRALSWGAAIAGGVAQGIRNNIPRVVLATQAMVAAIEAAVAAAPFAALGVAIIVGIALGMTVLKPIGNAINNMFNAIDAWIDAHAPLNLPLHLLLDLNPLHLAHDIAGALGRATSHIDIPIIGHAAGGVTKAAHVVGEAGPEAILPLTDAVFARLGKAIVAAIPTQQATSGAAPAVAMIGGAGATQHVTNIFNIPRPLDSSREIDPTNTAALLQQAWQRRGGGLS